MTAKTHAWSRLCGCAALIVLTWLTRADAAEFRELNTDRDAFTPATTTAKMGTVLTEASYVWIDNSGAPATNSFPELLVRIGTRERFEWRLGFNYEQGSGGAVVSAVEVGEPMLRLSNDSVQQYLGPGGHFMISPRLEIGCRMGWGLSSDAAGYYVDTGVGWTF